MKSGICEFYENLLKLYQFSFKRSIMRPTTSLVISESTLTVTRMNGRAPELLCDAQAQSSILLQLNFLLTSFIVPVEKQMPVLATESSVLAKWLNSNSLWSYEHNTWWRPKHANKICVNGNQYNCCNYELYYPLRNVNFKRSWMRTHLTEPNACYTEDVVTRLG